jgi:hypothetical protein
VSHSTRTALAEQLSIVFTSKVSAIDHNVALLRKELETRKQFAYFSVVK